MIFRSLRLAALILALSASLSFGASVLMNSGPEPSGSPRGATGGSAVTTDGFQESISAFQLRVSKGREFVAFLNKLNAAVKAANPDNPVKQVASFQEQLSKAFPGSTYDGNKGRIVFQGNFTATFNSNMVVDSISETGEISATYLLDQGQIVVTYGTNSVTVVLDRSTPSRSAFTKVSIPAMRSEAENILTIPGYQRKSADSVETAVLNDAYQLLSQTTGLRMDHFAAEIMRSVKMQNKALGIARRGYYERHPNEFQKGTSEPTATSKAIARSAAGATSGSVSAFSARLVLVILLALAFFWAILKMFGSIRLLFMDNLTRQYRKRYRASSPMVMRSLRKVGRSIWGLNFPWSRQFYVTKRSDRWTLSDRRIDRGNPQNQPDNLLEVCLRDNNFKIQILRLRGEPAAIVVRSSGFSQKELWGHLTRMGEVFTGGEAAVHDLVLPAGEGPSVP